MDSKKLDSWLASFLGCLEDFCEDLEDWLMSCRYSPCYDPDHSSDEAAFDEGRSPAWTIEEQDAIDDLLIYLEKRLPILKDDCPKDLKEHLNVTVNRDRLWALNLLSSSDRVQPRRKGASNLLTISRLMLVKGSVLTSSCNFVWKSYGSVSAVLVLINAMTMVCFATTKRFINFVLHGIMYLTSSTKGSL